MANQISETFNKLNGSTSEFKNKIQGEEKQLEKMAHNAGVKVGAMASNFANSAAETMKTGREYIQENPAKGVAMAAAAGVVVGGLLTLAMRRRQ